MRRGPIRGDEHPWRDFVDALVNAFFYRPQHYYREGWPTRFRLWRRR